MIADAALPLLLVVLNGFFVITEFAIVKVRVGRLEVKARTGSRAAGLANAIQQHPHAFLSAAQLGITVASLGLGWCGQGVATGLITPLLDAVGTADLLRYVDTSLGIGIGLEQFYAFFAFLLTFTLLTIVHVVFGELIPKALGFHRPTLAAVATAAPLHFFYRLFYPVIWIVDRLATALLHLVGLRSVPRSEIHSAEDLLLLLDQSRETGTILSTEHELIKNVFDFSERSARQIMVARPQIMALDVATTTDKILQTLTEEGYSRVPVFQDSIDNIIGVVYTKDVLTMITHRNLILLQDVLRPAYFVSENKKISDLLREFQQQKLHMAIVLDEFGGTAGIVTMEDIIEELVGEIQDEYDEEEPVVKESNANEYIVNAAATIADVNDLLPSPLPEGEEYETVGGLVNVIFEKIPDVNESMTFEGYELTVLKKSRRSIESVRLRISGTE